jgi:hypothetical protein
MSDFWSGLFLVGILTLGLAFGIIALLEIIFVKKRPRLNGILFAIILSLVGIWTIDRLIAGLFCLPWECVVRNIELESLLLDNSDLSDEWKVGSTSNTVYVPRASTNYQERTFDYISPLRRMVFYEEIYQYRSIRGASFQYAKLKKELPMSYSPYSLSISPQFDVQVRYASDYDFGCVLYDAKVFVCYYLARYDENMLLLEMRASDNNISGEIFSEIIGLADNRFSIILEKN